eukprot:c17789_g1_i1.p1 GENE.c17789_g1_i1~~c17789_g1_i1.p1  ORF type:complete len:752 (-),score=155.23 c17789_g1_i1:105-2360(-)
MGENRAMNGEEDSAFVVPSRGPSRNDSLTKVAFKKVWNNRRLSTARRAQGVILLVLIVFAIVLSTKFHDDPGMHVKSGCAVGVLCCCLVLVDAFLHPATRTHPNGIVLCRTMIDLLMSLHLLLENLTSPKYQHEIRPDTINQLTEDCRVWSGVFHGLLLASEMWLFCATYDLFRTMGNPFRDTSKDLRSYAAVITGLCIVFGVGLGRSSYPGLWANRTWCYIREMQNDVWIPNEGRYMLLYIPLLVMFIGHIGLLSRAGRRLNKGLPETQRTRVLVLSNSIVFLIISFLYWLLMSVLYLKHENGLVTFLMASRGMSDIQVWAIVKEFTVTSDHLEPGCNKALIDELMHYVTSGITTALKSAPGSPHIALPERESKRFGFSDIVHSLVHGEVHHTSLAAPLLAKPRGAKNPDKIVFDICCGAEFKRVRLAFDISDDEIEQELNKRVKSRKLEGGASNALFFFTRTERFIVKSLTPREYSFWKRKSYLHKTRALEYAEYVEVHRAHTRLCRIIGVYRLHLHGAVLPFFVMENAFWAAHPEPGPVAINEVYDLKGSRLNRSAAPVENGKVVVCRVCNQKYEYVEMWERRSISIVDHDSPEAECEYGLGGMHQPKQTKKDNDLSFRVHFESSQDVLQALISDTNFLASKFEAMDYSLLMGVITQPIKPSEVKAGAIPEGAFKATYTVVPVAYYFALIDLLQEWTWPKWFEHKYKTWILGKPKKIVSALPVLEYKSRFQNNLRLIFGTEEPRRAGL